MALLMTLMAWLRNVDYERNIAKVSVQILGRATPVELDFIQIEKT